MSYEVEWPEVRAALTPLLPWGVTAREATAFDWQLALLNAISGMPVEMLPDVGDVVRRLPREPHPNLSLLLREIGADKLNRPNFPPELVGEILEFAADCIRFENPRSARWVRRELFRRLGKRYGSKEAAALIAEYLDPAPSVPDAFDERGLLRKIDLSEPVAVHWLLEGMFREASVGIWAAPKGSGKSFGSLSLGLSVAFGRPWLGITPAINGHVHYVAAEGTLSFRDRMAAWLVREGLLPEEHAAADLAAVLDGRFSLSGGELQLDHPHLVDYLVRTIREDKTKLLILDTLGRLVGNQPIDSDVTANAVMGSLQRVANATGCTVLIQHHPGHSNLDRSRGSSAWEQAADFVFVSHGPAGALDGGGSMRLVNTKQREAESSADMIYSLDRVSDMSSDGRPFGSMVFVPSKAPVAEMPLQERILASIRGYPGCSLREIRDRVRGKSQDISHEVQLLIDGERIENRGKGGSRTAAEYYAIDSDEEITGSVDLTDAGVA
jgi:hypothetical protein